MKHIKSNNVSKKFEEILLSESVSKKVQTDKGKEFQSVSYMQSRNQSIAS